VNENPLTRRAAADWPAVLFAIVFPSVVTWVYFVWLKQNAAFVQQTAYGIGKGMQFAFPLFGCC